MHKGIFILALHGIALSKGIEIDSLKHSRMNKDHMGFLTYGTKKLRNHFGVILAFGDKPEERCRKFPQHSSKRGVLKELNSFLPV